MNPLSSDTSSQVMGLSPKYLLLEQIGNRLPKLTENNYIEWRTKFKGELRCLKVLHHLTDDPPTDMNETWELIDGQICRIIMNKSPLEFLHLIEDLETAKEIWSKTVQRYEKVTAAQRRDIFQEWCTCQIAPSASIEDHLKTYKKLAAKLDAADCKINEELKVIQLFQSLPEQFNTFVASTIVQSGDSITMTLDEAILKIKAYHKFDLQKQSSTSPATALTTVPRKSAMKKPPPGPCPICQNPNHWRSECPKNFCDYCKGKGHIKKNCFKFLKHSPQHVALSNVTSPAPEADLSEEITHAAMATFGNYSSSSWILDTGASRHMTNDKSHFITYRTLSSPIIVQSATNETALGIGEGDIRITMYLQDKPIKWTLKNVIHVPNLRTNLFALGPLIDSHTLIHNGEHLFIKCNTKNIQVAHAVWKGNLFELVTQPPVHANLANSSETDLWHRRLGHLSAASLRYLVSNNMVEGIKGLTGPNIELLPCENCEVSNIHRSPHPPVSRQRGSRPLEVIHSDVFGPVKPASIQNKIYFVSFIDDFTRFAWIFHLRHKSEVFSAFKLFKAHAENKSKQITHLISDRGANTPPQLCPPFLRTSGFNTSFPLHGHLSKMALLSDSTELF
jgi:hypothetical protein